MGVCSAMVVVERERCLAAHSWGIVCKGRVAGVVKSVVDKKVGVYHNTGETEVNQGEI